MNKHCIHLILKDSIISEIGVVLGTGFGNHIIEHVVDKFNEVF